MRRFGCGIATASLSLTLVAGAWAGPEGYASRFQNIKAGVVVLDSDRVNASAPARSSAPYTFYNLDQAAPIKPASWSFSNPYAPSVVTGPIATRWASINAFLPASAVKVNPTVGDKISKRNAAYWEVSLGSLSDTQLANYDILLVAPRYAVNLNPAERNKLRRFVDNGGLLWIEAGALATTFDVVNNFPVSYQLITGSETGNEQSDFSQPLLNRPNAISTREMSLLNQETWSVNNWLMRSAVPAGITNTLFTSFENEFQQLLPIATVTRAGGQTYWSIASSRIGEGTVVMSSRGIASKLNLPATFTNIDDNSGYVARDLNAGAAAAAAAKFAVNIVNLGSQYRQASGSSRKTASSLVSVDAPLLERFRSEAALDPATRQSPPVIYKGVTIATDGDKLVAWDSNPASDLDNDGNPDDGIKDYGSGGSEDRIWETPAMPGPLSAPVCVEVARSTNGRPVDQVLVVDSQGTLHAFGVFPRDAAGRFRTLTPRLYAQNPPNGPADFGGFTPNAPTVHENYAVMADNYSASGGRRGRIWVQNLRLGRPMGLNNPMVLGGTNSDVLIGDISSSPTVGYVPILDNSGGVDRLIYVPTRPTGAGSNNPNNTASITSIWLGSKGERPIDWDDSTGALIITTRAAQQGGLTIYLPDPTRGSAEGELSPRITVIKSNGDPLTVTEMNNIFAGAATTGAGGVLSFPLKSGAHLPAGSSIRVDYTINWADATPGIMANAVRGSINVPDATNSHPIIGSLALSPMGTVFAVVGNGSIGGSLIGVREEGRGAFRCTLRYELFDQHVITLNDAAETTYREVLTDNDPANIFIPSANADDARLRDFAMRTGPSIRNGQVLVGARAAKYITVPGIGRVKVPVGLLLAFRAEPEVAEIPVGNIGSGITLLQPDLARSTDRTKPNTQSIFSESNFSYNPSQGVIRIDNLMTGQRGPMLSSFNLSQPIIVRPANGPDRLIDPDAVGGRWSPLLWYSTFTGLEVPNSPSGVVTTGGTVYIAGESRAPNVLSGKGITPVGQIFALDAQISPNDPSLLSWSLRPWVKQMTQIINTGGGITGNEHIRWPQLKGITGLEDYIIRLNQTILPNSETSYGVVGGEGSLVAWGDGGIYSFNRSDFVVCDQGRFGIFDASGNVSFTSDSVALLGGNGVQAAANIRPLARPVKAYSLGNGDSLVVDQASNRVSRVDSSSREVRSITGFQLDSRYVPTGYDANDSTKLLNPMDAASWSEYTVRSGTGFLASQASLEWWVHYLIADTGNQRLVEVVDRYSVDAATRRILGPVTISGVPQLGVLVWQSPKAVSGAGFGYMAINRVYRPATADSPARYIYVSGVSNISPSRSSVGLDTDLSVDTSVATRGGNGGIVIMDPADPKFVRVINQMLVDDTSSTPFWYAPQSAFRTATEVADPILTNRRKGGLRRLSNLASVTAQIVNIEDEGVLAVMISDATGVYELIIGDESEDSANISWFLPSEAYVSLRRSGNTGAPSDTNPKQFRPTYARRLDNGDIIIVNGYVGQRRNGNSFSGEVLQLNGELSDPSLPNLGFGLSSIRFELGPIQGTRGLLQPVFADRR